MTAIAIQHTEEDLLDDRPIALRRKKRSISSLANPEENLGQIDELSIPDHEGVQYPKTPTKSKKRVRFSDSGLEPAASSSTGLTPFFKRTTLMPKDASSPPLKLRKLSQNPRKRHSLPINLSASLPSSSLLPPPTNCISGDVQFEPFRQALDERTKRRLKRNNMSEELNDIAEDTRSISQLTQEVQDLKEELASVKQSGQEVKEPLENENGDSEQIQALEEQLAELRQQMRERSTAADSSLPPTDMGTPTSGGSNHGDADDSINVNNNEDGNLQVSTSVQTSVQTSVHTSIQRFLSSLDATTQASLPVPTHVAVFKSARMSLERLFPGEIPLGLDTEDPGPLLKIMIDRLYNMATQVSMVQESLSTSENQEANLRNQFNAVLQQVERARHNAEHLSGQLASEQVRGNKAEGRIKQLETGVSERVKDLETELDDKQRSNKKLQDALESYRVEVRKLEGLISNMETNHRNSMSNLREEMNGLVDLDCQITAESTGRRAAEKEAAERGHTIKQLERTERELKRAMNDKQRIIQDIEKEFHEMKERHQQETGRMNVTIGKLSSNLQEAYDELIRYGRERERLIEMLEEEKAASIEAVKAVEAASVEAVEAIQADLARCSETAGGVKETVEGVKETHANGMQRRGAEVAEHRGLLTPVIACKFKDVEGYVEVKRGKAKGKRPDSGIGVLEEDDLEDQEYDVEDEEMDLEDHEVDLEDHEVDLEDHEVDLEEQETDHDENV